MKTASFAQVLAEKMREKSDVSPRETGFAETADGSFLETNFAFVSDMTTEISLDLADLVTPQAKSFASSAYRVLRAKTKRTVTKKQISRGKTALRASFSSDQELALQTLIYRGAAELDVETLTEQQLKSTFRYLARRWHPDSHALADPEVFATIKECYDCLRRCLR